LKSGIAGLSAVKERNPTAAFPLTRADGSNSNPGITRRLFEFRTEAKTNRSSAASAAIVSVVSGVSRWRSDAPRSVIVRSNVSFRLVSRNAALGANSTVDLFAKNYAAVTPEIRNSAPTVAAPSCRWDRASISTVGRSRVLRYDVVKCG